MTKDEALKLALVIEEFDNNDETLPLELLKVIAATLRALAQPEQEPWPEEPFGHMAGGVQPAQEPWVGLTESERNDIEDYCEMIIGKAAFDAIEAKLQEKNI